MPHSNISAKPTSGTANRSVRSVVFLWVLAVLCVVIIAASVLASVLYAAHQIDGRAVSNEIARANNALSVSSSAGLTAGELGAQYLFDNAHFAAADQVAAPEVAVPVPHRPGQVFAWTPRRIASDVFMEIAPLRLGISGLFVGMVIVILWQMTRLARSLDAARQNATERATRDALTALVNRAGFEARLDDLFARNVPVGLLYLDLDSFKAVNDSYGHSVGDEVLRCIGRRFAGFESEAITIARIGGDEFVAIVARPASRATLEELANDLTATLAEPVPTLGGPIHVGVSIGIAERTTAAESPTALVQAADAALYGAKFSGKLAV